jgi:hypothetical protein
MRGARRPAHPLDWYRDADGRALDARLHLLDRQMLDPDGVPVSTVDDLELDAVALGEPVDHDHPPTVSAILVGAAVLPRIFGGGMPRSRWARIAWDRVADLGTVITLRDRADRIDAVWLERWIRDRIVARIPGGAHDPE